MTAELEVAYLGVEVADPAAFGAFLADVVGLVPGEPDHRRRDRVAQRRPCPPNHRRGGTGERRRLRRPRSRFTGRLRAEPSTGPAPPARRSRRAPLRDAAARRVERSSASTRRGASRSSSCTDWPPRASRSTRRSCPAASSRRTRGSVTWCSSLSDLDAADRFAREALGFTQSDWLETDLGWIAADGALLPLQPAPPLPRPRRAPIELPQKLHHVMVETVSQDNVGAAFDRAWKAGLPIANALGKHDNDKMFSFYVVTPAGLPARVRLRRADDRRRRGPTTAATTGSASGVTSRSSRPCTRHERAHRYERTSRSRHGFVERHRGGYRRQLRRPRRDRGRQLGVVGRDGPAGRRRAARRDLCASRRLGPARGRAPRRRCRRALRPARHRRQQRGHDRRHPPQRPRRGDARDLGEDPAGERDRARGTSSRPPRHTFGPRATASS